MSSMHVEANDAWHRARTGADARTSSALVASRESRRTQLLSDMAELAASHREVAQKLKSAPKKTRDQEAARQQEEMDSMKARFECFCMANEDGESTKWSWRWRTEHQDRRRIIQNYRRTWGAPKQPMNRVFTKELRYDDVARCLREIRRSPEDIAMLVTKATYTRPVLDSMLFQLWLFSSAIVFVSAPTIRHAPSREFAS